MFSKFKARVASAETVLLAMLRVALLFGTAMGFSYDFRRNTTRDYLLDALARLCTLCGEAKSLCHTLEAAWLGFRNVRVWRVLSINVLVPQNDANRADGIGGGEISFLGPCCGLGNSASAE